MTRFLSARGDFKGRTLAALPAEVSRFAYMASLAGPGDRFSHAGLEREHGTAPAQDAIKTSFLESGRALIGTGVQELWAEIDSIPGLTGDSLQSAKAVWASTAGHSSRETAHLNYVVDALALLLQERRANPAA